MSQNIRFEVSSLSCAGCAGRAERALAAVDQVETASVNLPLKTAQVSGSAGAAVLQAALTKAGYPAVEERIRLSITGMSCASCSGRVERALAAQSGVVEASVNLATNTAEITVLKGAVSAGQLAQTVTETGYAASVVTGETNTQQTDEAVELRRDMIVASALTAPVFVAEMAGHVFPPLHHAINASIGMTAFWAIQFLLITAVMAGPGRRFYKIGLPLLVKGAPDMNSLVALGTLAAWAYSTVSLAAPALLPEGARAVYFESAGVIIALILLGRWLEARAKSRAGDAIRALVALRPETATILRADGTQETIPAESILPDDHLIVKPGARIPADGVVADGQGHVDESMISGEPIPVHKTRGDTLLAGTINGHSALTFRVTHAGHETALARIIDMVQQAQGAKLPIQALADRVIRVFVPVVLVIAAVTVALWLMFGPDLAHALVAGVSVLIIACPCAMGLATPMSIMVGTGRAAQLGILFRRGDALQRLGDVGVVAFDKTGTLTEGRPTVVETRPLGDLTDDALLRLVAAAETRSEHPLAQAIVSAVDTLLPDVTASETVAGHGMRARVEGRNLLIGNARLMTTAGIDIKAATDTIAVMSGRGQTPVLVAVDGTISGVIGIADRLKPEARPALEALRDAGIETAMITGDARATAEAVAAGLPLGDIEAEVLPDGKAAAVTALRDRFGSVAFVGDGINDAPALAEADVGFAIGTGTDVAIETGDVVLANGNPVSVAEAIVLSKRVMRNIRQNLGWAFGYNIVLIPVAAGALYPLFGVMLSPMLAAGAMALSSVFVVTNALRLRNAGPSRPEPKAAAPDAAPQPAE